MHEYGVALACTSLMTFLRGRPGLRLADDIPRGIHRLASLVSENHELVV